MTIPYELYGEVDNSHTTNPQSFDNCMRFDGDSMTSSQGASAKDEDPIALPTRPVMTNVSQGRPKSPT
jgi:hypothetical protein